MFNDATSVVGKPNGLRATEWAYDEFCGQTSANGQVYGTAAAGVAADLAGKVLGDMGGLIMARLITPPGTHPSMYSSISSPSNFSTSRRLFAPPLI